MATAKFGHCKKEMAFPGASLEAFCHCIRLRVIQIGLRMGPYLYRFDPNVRWRSLAKAANAFKYIFVGRGQVEIESRGLVGEGA